MRTFQRWVQDGDAIVAADARTTSVRPPPAHKLSDAEREQILAVANSEEFASLPPSQIVPALADRASAMTMPMLNRCSALVNTGRTTRESRLEVWNKRRHGRRNSCVGTTRSISTAA
jgi:hypothetical protein